MCQPNACNCVVSPFSMGALLLGVGLSIQLLTLACALYVAMCCYEARTQKSCKCHAIQISTHRQGALTLP